MSREYEITMENFLQLLMEQNQLPFEMLESFHQSAKPSIPEVTQFKEYRLFLKHLYDLRKTNITIQSDYDPDGICSGILLYYSLKLLGVTANLYYPKTSLGFGVSKASIDEIMVEFPDTQTLITCDNGVVAFEGIDHATTCYGLNVLVTDHHLGIDGPERVNALAVVNPNQYEDLYPFKGICGTTVIYKLMKAYIETVKPSVLPIFEDLIVLVGLATVSDIMPLHEENRYYVRQALTLLNSELFYERGLFDDAYRELDGYYYGLKALMNELSISGKVRLGQAKADTFGFYLSPMLNSPRRMLDSSGLGFEVFLQSTFEDAKRVVKELFVLNEERKRYTAKALKEIQLPDKINHSIVVVTEAISGVVGILAGQIMNDSYGIKNGYLPTLVLTGSKDEAGEYLLHGSARSPQGLSFIKALDRVNAYHPEYIHHYGGHASAAGVAIYGSYLEEFRKALDEAFALQLDEIAQSDDQTLQQAKMICLATKDSVMPSRSQLQKTNGLFVIRDESDITTLIECLYELSEYEPFGQGFKPPQFTIAVEVDDLLTQQIPYRLMGKDGRHLKIQFKGLDVIRWNEGSDFEDRLSLSGATYLKLTGVLSVNVFNERESLQLLLDRAIQYV